jgi:hypothetical protein
MLIEPKSVRECKLRLRTSQPFKGTGQVCITVLSDKTAHSVPLRASIWPSPSLLVDQIPLNGLASALHSSKTINLRLKNESVNDSMNVSVVAVCENTDCKCHDRRGGLCQTFLLPDFQVCMCSVYLHNISGWSMYLCIYVSMYLCIYASVYLCIYVSMYLCTYVSTYLRVYWIYVAVYLCIYVSISVSICLFVHVSIYLRVYVTDEY